MYLLMFIIIPLSAIFIILFVFLFFNILANIIGAPFVPSPDARIQTAIKMLQPLEVSRVVEIGSGDGRVAIALAEQGLRVHGIEINPIWVVKSKLNAKALKTNNVSFEWVNLWHKDLGQFDAVFVYGISHIMDRLEKKLEKELEPCSPVLSAGFQFPNWRHDREINGVYLYRVPDRSSSA